MRRARLGLGGGYASNNDNGDTAPPAHVYTEHEWQRALNPYDRIIKDGKLWRIETDGDGHLKDPICEATLTYCYGVPVADLDPNRKRADQRRGNGAGAAAFQRRRAMTTRQLIFNAIARHPDKTIADIVTITGKSDTTVRTHVKELRRDGAIECAPRRNKWGHCLYSTWRVVL
jgi:DNA-binding transcriptional ArsR family regulator